MEFSGPDLFIIMNQKWCNHLKNNNETGGLVNVTVRQMK